MRIGNWAPRRDNAVITLTLGLPLAMATVHNGFQPWSIPQPQLRKMTAQQAQECKEGAKDIFTPLLADFLSDIKIAPDKCLCADMYSQHALLVVKCPTHKKGKF